jgi:hypothetical protein
MEKMQWVSIPDAAAMLKRRGVKMSAPTLIRLVRDGEVKGMKIGNRFFVSKEEVERILSGKPGEEAK